MSLFTLLTAKFLTVTNEYMWLTPLPPTKYTSKNRPFLATTVQGAEQSMSSHQPLRYRWIILALLTMISTFVAAIPASCMPVLFKEIAEDLGLSLVQVGTIWGFTSLAGIFVSLVSGILGDRFGVKLIIGVASLLVGITGALRGLASSFLMLAFLVFLNGVVRLILPINATKTIGIWFRGQHLGVAMGISAMGMGLGLMLGPLISASILSPLLGGWRNVMFFYGGISVVVGVLWFIFGKELHDSGTTMANPSRKTIPFKQVFSRLIKLKALWLIGLTILFRSASIMGTTGYLPMYLRNQGWATAAADGTLSVFYAASTLAVVPLSLVSDRLGSRKAILLPAIILTMVSIGILPFVNESAIWILVILAGITMDGFMAIAVTLLLETEGVGQANSGTALGMVFTIAQFGSVVSPPLGNSLARFNPGLPFVFWAALSIIAVITLLLARETRRKGFAADLQKAQ